MKTLREQLIEEFDSLTNQIPTAYKYYWNKPARGIDWCPVDIVEDNSKYTLKADLPGLSADDISMETKDGLLVIKASRKLSKESSTTTSERREIKLDRQFKLPKNISEDKIKATMDKGVLTVVVPKLKKQNCKKIKVTSA